MVALASLAIVAALLGSPAVASLATEPGAGHGIALLSGTAMDVVGVDAIPEHQLVHLAEHNEAVEIRQGHRRALLQSKTASSKKKNSKGKSKPKKSTRRKRSSTRSRSRRGRSPARKTRAKPKRKATSKPPSQPKRKPAPKRSRKPTAKPKPAPKKKKSAPKPPKPAPKPSPRPAPPAKTIESVITTSVSKCGSVMSEIPTGRHQPFLKPPPEAAKEYAGVVGADGRFKMAYKTIKRGGEYCTAAGSKAKTVVFGGMMFWHKNDKCFLPPTQKDGSPCCEMFMWQPNTAGFYYDNCSMRMEIEGDGKWWFTTEVPGDESKVGWGPDPAPHIHYDIRCSGCAATSAYDTSKYQYWSKFYAERICTHEKCGDVDAADHLSTKTKGPGGVTLFKYNFELPAKSKGKL
eukprot:jgi/Ulvmu1/3238/UM150_0011.1